MKFFKLEITLSNGQTPKNGSGIMKEYYNRKGRGDFEKDDEYLPLY